MKSKLSWKWVVLVSVVFVLFVSLALPQIDSYSKRITGQANSPDTSFIYSAKELYKMAEGYGESGRAAYIKLRWTFDLAWPILYTLFLLVWIIKISQYMARTKGLKILVLIPLLAMGFDFLENIGASVVMHRYPLDSGIIAKLTPIMTLAKWISLSVSFLVILLLLIFVGIDKIKENLHKGR